MNRLTVAMAFTMLAAGGWAQEPGTSRKGERGTQTPVTQSLKKGPAFQVRGIDYRVVGGLRAVGVGARQDRDATLGSVGAPASAVVEEKGRFVIYRGGGTSPLVSATAVNGTATFPVVENVRTGTLGILPGVVVVVLKAPFDATTIARDSHLELVGAFPEISTAFFRVPEGANIQAVAAELAKAAKVVSVDIEVIENVASPQ